MRTPHKIGMAVAAMALALSGCGGSSSNGSSSASQFDADAKSAAEGVTDEFLAVPAAPDLVALSQTPSADRSVTMISCPLPDCTLLADSFTEAAETLGWNVNIVVSDFTPESFISAWDTALTQNPDGIFYLGLIPDSAVAAQLQRAKDAGIWVVSNSGPEGTEFGGDSPIVGGVQPPRKTEQGGRIQASLVIEDAESTEGVVYMYPPGVASYELTARSFTETIEQAGGSVEDLEVSQADIGTAIPQQVVSYLQSHPDTAYIVVPDIYLLTGVADAITAAGIELPKLIAMNRNAETEQDIEDGRLFATNLQDPVIDTWYAVDMMARLSVGDELTDREPLGVSMLVTQDNVSDVPVRFAGIPDSFATAWGVA